MIYASLRVVTRAEIHLFAQMSEGGGGGDDRATILAQIRQKHCRILIVDDEPLFRRSIELKMRSRYRADVDFAAAGSRAIQKATTAERPFDLILLDIRLQKLNGSGAAELDGVDVYDVLVHQGVTTPILFMTASVDDDVRAKVAARKKKLHRKESQTLFKEIESILLHCRGGDE